MTFYYGVDFYPEHWPRTTWETYAKQMREAHFNVVRVAEFAWVMMEPEEGVYVFDWLDDAIATLHNEGISVVLGTPTASMPAWLKEKYPETLASSDGRHRVAWGVRKNNCCSSGAYRLLSERITRAMAEHYSGNPAVIGWQTDNEIDGPECRCDTCRREFQSYLRGRYGSIVALNKAWGTHFWGHLYASWDEIYIPMDMGGDNPSLCLDWRRFHSWNQARFQLDQIRILRELCPDQFVTHNFMGFANWSDCYKLAEDLDFVGYDSYPGFPGADAPSITYGTSAACDFTRGLKGRNYWIIETTAGPTGWGEFGRSPRPGEMRKTFYQHVAHGADAQIFFRWRTCTAGREQYWHGLLGHDGKVGRRYNEAAEIGKEIKDLAPYLEGTTPNPDVAIIYDYDSRWATSIQPGFKGNDYIGRINLYYNALLRAGIGVDIIPSTRDLSRYRVVIAPQLHVLSDETATRLCDFVRSGGVFVADARTGVKTETNLCHERTLPGLLADVLGIEISEYESFSGEYKITGGSELSGSYTGHGYADWITLDGAEGLVSHEMEHMAEFAAVTRCSSGKGTGYYVGTVVREDAFYDALVQQVLTRAGVTALIAPPPGVEIALRQGASGTLAFVINHTEATVSVDVPEGLHNLTTGQIMGSSLPLDPFGAAVLLVKK